MAKSQVDIADLAPNAKDTGDKPPKSTERKRSTSPTAEKNLRERLVACFERIGAAVEQRGDEELAEIVLEDASIMAQGLVSLTRPFKALRTPLLAAIAIVEPALAFGRIVRVLAGRFAERRAQAQYEAAQREEQQT